MSANTNKLENTLADDFLKFINNCPSQFHAVAEITRRLKAANFVQLSEKNDRAFAEIKPNGRYFLTRNQSTIIAFAVGNKYKPGNGFTIAAAHTDSPVLKIKPFSKSERCGFIQVGVEPYGGGLWYTWFDRDLSIAGRVIVSTGTEAQPQFVSQLVQIKRPLLRIPSLAIHLNREINEKGFQFNLQTNALPILATHIKSELNKPTKEEKNDDVYSKNQAPLYDLIASELGVKTTDIKHLELCLYDTQPAALYGIYNEFICARGLDNLMMSYICMQALIDSCNDSKLLENEENIRMVGLFDNEEVGSDSCMGAGSNMLSSLLRRIVNDSIRYDSAIARSFLVSADMAHALHPNFSDKHEDQHRPMIHHGLVIKHNANQRYATSSISSFLLSEIAKRHNIMIQRFAVRNDMGCGSTIGPILSSNCGIRTVDVGVPQLSMHSIRETCGTADIAHAFQLILAYFLEFPILDKSLTVDDKGITADK